MQQTFITWVCTAGRPFADKAGGKGNLSDNLNAAAPSCWKFDQDGLTISSLSEMYPMAVIWLFWAWDSFWVACRCWLPSHIPNKSWTLAILCNFLSSTSLWISMLFSVSVVSNAGLLPAYIPLLPQANCFNTTFLRRVSHVVFDYLQPIMSCPREKLARALTPSGMIETISHATLERSVYFECISSCWCHQSVISSIQNVLRISMGSE